MAPLAMGRRLSVRGASVYMLDACLRHSYYIMQINVTMFFHPEFLLLLNLQWRALIKFPQVKPHIKGKPAPSMMIHAFGVVDDSSSHSLSVLHFSNRSGDECSDVSSIDNQIIATTCF